MRYPLLTLTALCLLLAACGKEKPRQFSTWYVNSDSFVTNEVALSTTRAENALYSLNKENGFSFSDGNNGFANPPDPGTYILSADYASGNPSLHHAYFYYNGFLYMLLPGQADTLIITRPANKYRYTLRPGWFVNTANAADSVQIHGVFNEP